MDETTTTSAPAPSPGDWSDPIEEGVRGRVRAFIEAILEEGPEAALGRGRCERADEGPRGWRHGRRDRQVIGTSGAGTVSVPRARLAREDGGTAGWRSKGLRRDLRLTERAEALIAGACPAGTSTRRARRALAALFEGAVGKAVVSRAWRKVRTDWEARNARDLGDEDIVRLILDGTVVRARIDRKATALSLLVAVGVRRDGQKTLLALRTMGGEGAPAWTAFLEDMTRRGLKAPGLVVVDGAPGLEAALAAPWSDVPCGPTSRSSGARLTSAATCSRTRRSGSMTSWPRPGATWACAETAAGVEARRKALVRKWRPKCIRHCRSDQWRDMARRRRQPRGGRGPPPHLHAAAARPAEVRSHDGCGRAAARGAPPPDQDPRAVLPQAGTAPVLVWAPLASGQIVMRKVDGWETLSVPLADQPIDLAA